MQKIVPFLWYDGKAEEAMTFYVSIFKNSKIGAITRCGEHGPGPKGSVLLASFQLEGQDFMALNGGPMYKFTEAISLYVNCETQAEIDDLWEKLSAGGQKIQCGWLKDKFGVAWQIIPSILGKLMNDPDPAKLGRVVKAMFDMTKFDIEKLKEAHAGLTDGKIQIDEITRGSRGCRVFAEPGAPAEK